MEHLRAVRKVSSRNREPTVRNRPSDPLSARGDDMAPTRQRLSQRRKAAGLAQGSLAQGMRVERSTVARWEAGDTQPLPSIRPHVSRSSRVPVVAQPVSAEFGRSVAVDANPEAAIALPPARPGRLADIDHPANINIADVNMRPFEPAPVTVGIGEFAGFCITQPAHTDVSDLSSVTTIPLNLPLAGIQRRPDRSWRFKRFAAAGVLALVGSTASVSFLTSHNEPIRPATVGNPAPAAPMVVIPAPSSNEVTGASAQNKPADAPAASGAATVSTPQTTRSSSRSKPPAAKVTPPRPRTPAAAEAYARAQMAKLSGSDQSRTRLRPGFSSHP